MDRIDLTGVDLVSLAKVAYELSVPQGLGHFHFKPEPLGDYEAKMIVGRSKDDKRIALSMDYVAGRACKLTVFRDGDKLYMPNTWYDHTDKQLAELLRSVDVAADNVGGEHSMACNCVECQEKQGKDHEWKL